MNRPPIGRFGIGNAAANDVAHRLVAGDLVADRHIAAGHTAGGCRIGRQRIGPEPRPQHESIRTWRARRDAEAERIAVGPASGLGGRATDHRRARY
jgi:hypothetical protein